MAAVEEDQRAHNARILRDVGWLSRSLAACISMCSLTRNRVGLCEDVLSSRFAAPVYPPDHFVIVAESWEDDASKNVVAKC